MPHKPLPSVELFSALLNHQLSPEHWARLAVLDPALGRIEAWRSRANALFAACAIACLVGVAAAALLATAFLTLLLVPMLKPEFTESVEPTIRYIGDRLLSLPMNRPCLVTPTNLLPDAVAMQLLRAPVTDCGFCRNLTEVPKASQLDPNKFYTRYADARVPLVVTDGARDWRLSHLSFEFFKELYSPGTLADDHCQFFPYKTEFRDLGEFFAMPEARARMESGFAPWYVGWSNCSPRIAAILRSYYSRPYFLPRESETLGTDWIFMGSPNYGAHLHVDDVGHLSWQAQVRGRKRWELVPPLECSYECQALSVVVEPGQVIALDTTLWYHATNILPGEMSIAIGAEFD